MSWNPWEHRPRNLARSQAFDVRNAAGSVAELDLYDAVGEFEGIDPATVTKAVRGITAKRIVVHLNSPGGDYFGGVAIYNALRNHPATVDVQVEGIAASAASVIAMAGNTVSMHRGAQMMIHDAISGAYGNADDFTKRAALLSKCSEDIAGIYAARTGVPAGNWRDAMKAETWYNGTEAVTAHLADTSEDDAPAMTGLARADDENGLLLRNGIRSAFGQPVMTLWQERAALIAKLLREAA